MRILVVDSEGMALDFVMRAVAQDHDVRWYRYATKPTRDGEGILKPSVIVKDWRDHMSWVGKDGLVLTTGNWRFVQELDRYREFGFKIFGPTVASAKLEIDRSSGMEVMKAVGIDLPPYQTFSTLEEASKFAWKTDRAWVAKPLGDEADKAMTYVASDPADLAGWLDRQISAGKKLKGPLMLQEKIDMLCEIGISAWFGPEGCIRDAYGISFEHKKMMNDELFCNTGEQGTVCQYSDNEKLADELLDPLEPVLRALGHCGDFSVGCGVDKKGKVWPFEFTCRQGWPAFFIQTASHRGDIAQWMLDLLNGKESLRVSYDCAVGVVCAQPPYPSYNAPPEMVEGNPISGVEGIENQIHLVSAMRERGPKLEGGKVVSGMVLKTTGPYVLVCTGLAKSLSQARERVYRAADTVKFANIGYRTDIGDKVAKVLSDLHRFGYALDLNS